MADYITQRQFLRANREAGLPLSEDEAEAFYDHFHAMIEDGTDADDTPLGLDGDPFDAAEWAEQRLFDIAAHCLIFRDVAEFNARQGTDFNAVEDILNHPVWGQEEIILVRYTGTSDDIQ